MTFSKDQLKRSSFEHAVQVDKEYHATYFTKYHLGDENSWIASPDDFVMRHIKFIPCDGVVIDLGCGPGRLALPILRHLQKGRGRIICIDYLDEALTSLQINAKPIDHSMQLVPIKGDLAHLELLADSIDSAIAWSVWDATFSPDEIREKLKELRDAVRSNGCVFVMFNTNITCVVNGNNSMQMQQEQNKRGNMTAANAKTMLLDVYKEWEIIEITERGDTEVVPSGETIAEWKSVQIMFAARRRSGGSDAIT